MAIEAERINRGQDFRIENGNKDLTERSNETIQRVVDAFPPNVIGATFQDHTGQWELTLSIDNDAQPNGFALARTQNGKLAEMYRIEPSRAVTYINSPMGLVERGERALVRLEHKVDLLLKPSEVENKIGLTPRELEILELAGRGHTSRETADALEISEQTVKNHKTSILKKAGAKNIVEVFGRMHGALPH